MKAKLILLALLTLLPGCGIIQHHVYKKILRVECVNPLSAKNHFVYVGEATPSYVASSNLLRLTGDDRTVYYSMPQGSACVISNTEQSINNV